MMFQPENSTPRIAKRCVRCVEGVAGDESSKQTIVASIFVRSEPLLFFLVGHIKGPKNSNHPYRDDELKESIQPAVS
jgi:hypothetical protein